MEPTSNLATLASLAATEPPLEVPNTVFDAEKFKYATNIYEDLACYTCDTDIIYHFEEPDLTDIDIWEFFEWLKNIVAPTRREFIINACADRIWNLPVTDGASYIHHALTGWALVRHMAIHVKWLRESSRGDFLWENASCRFFRRFWPGTPCKCDVVCQRTRNQSAIQFDQE